MNDPHDLQRFVGAQQPIFDTVLAELRLGEKASHWMWFVFPQVEGLGRSAMARRFAIRSRSEAAAYLGHALLGGRLNLCSRIVAEADGRSAHQIFGSPDDLKFHSSMTLFAEIAASPNLFEDNLRKYFGGERDPGTRRWLAASAAET